MTQRKEERWPEMAINQMELLSLMPPRKTEIASWRYTYRKSGERRRALCA